MSVARLELGSELLVVEFETRRLELPCGALALSGRHFTSDPPQPEDLTNAIGDAMDHLDDAKREIDGLENADIVIVGGDLACTIAAIELGGTLVEPTFVLGRDAAEDVFRTMATERRAERAHNPGLPAAHVDEIVGACCALVAVMRGLHLERVDVDAGPGRHHSEQQSEASA